MNDPHQKIKITRNELYSSDVDVKLRQESALLGRILIPEKDISPLRRLLLSSIFYFPAAGVVGAIVAWAVAEPSFEDNAIAAGEIVIVNQEPFEAGANQEAVMISLTDSSLWVYPGHTKFEAGEGGQPPFTGMEALQPGVVIEAAGILTEDQHLAAMAIRPCSEERAASLADPKDVDQGSVINYFLFPLVSGLVVFFIVLFEGISSRNFYRMFRRLPLSVLLAVVFTFLAFIPAGIAMSLLDSVMTQEADQKFFVTVHNLSNLTFVAVTIFRSLAWVSIGAAIGLGMNIVGSTRLQLRNSVLGGTLGGGLGGLLFDPISRFLTPASAFSGAEVSRIIGFIVLGFSIGFFIAMVQRMGREAWIRVCTGPLSGKAFVLHRSPTTIGSATDADIYLFKDPDIDPSHAAIHRLGCVFEIEDLGSRCGVRVDGDPVRSRILVSGDRIVIGATVLQFEERVNLSFSGSAGSSTEVSGA